MRGACWGQRANLRLPTFLVGPDLRTVQGTLQPGKESETGLAWVSILVPTWGFQGPIVPRKVCESCLLGGGTCIMRAQEGL